MANRVEVFDPPQAIAWQPGQGPDERGNLSGNSELDLRRLDLALRPAARSGTTAPRSR